MTTRWDPEDDRPRSLTELAQYAGIVRTTLVNWTQRTHALPTTETSDGRLFVSWRQLVAYCRAHPELRAAQKILQVVEVDSSSSPSTAQVDVEGILAVARNMRAAVQANLEALIAAASQAEDTARVHREQLEHLRASFNAYDDALLQFTAAQTPND